MFIYEYFEIIHFDNHYEMPVLFPNEELVAAQSRFKKSDKC